MRWGEGGEEERRHDGRPFIYRAFQRRRMDDGGLVEEVKDPIPMEKEYVQ